MRKIITTLALMITVAAYAGPKADLQKAESLLKQNKQQEAIQVLEASKPSKGEEAEYAQINLFLAQNAKDNKQAISYLEKAANSGKNDFSVNALNSLSSILPPQQAMPYLLKLNSYVPNNASILSRLAILSLELKDNSKYNMYVSQAKALKDVNQKATFYILTGSYLLSKNNTQGLNMLNDAIKLNNPEVSSIAYKTISEYYYLIKKDTAMGAKYLPYIYLANPNDPNAYVTAAQLSYNTQDATKAYAIYKKGYQLALKTNKLDDPILEYGFLLATASKNTKDAKIYESKLKKSYKANDFTLANLLVNSNLVDQSISYYKAALSSKDANVKQSSAMQLIKIYALAKKDYKTAKSFISSKYFNSSEIKNLTEQLNNLMKK